MSFATSREPSPESLGNHRPACPLVIKPRFKWHTGHVTVGGSMCTELLTPGGWQPMTVHALLLTVCQMLRQGEAQIQLKPDEHCMWPLKDYSEMEAREAYERVAKFHGWPTQRPIRV